MCSWSPARDLMICHDPPLPLPLLPAFLRNSIIKNRSKQVEAFTDALLDWEMPYLYDGLRTFSIVNQVRTGKTPLIVCNASEKLIPNTSFSGISVEIVLPVYIVMTAM